jgi:hypothetical protein
MRHRINHEWPDDVQPCPEDNTSVYVNAQIVAWRRLGVLIHPQSAMEIAAWWHGHTGYGHDFGAFSQTGMITDDLLAAIDSEIAATMTSLQHAHATMVNDEDLVSDYADGLNALHALRAYVLECKVTPWVVGHNMAGYSPEPDNMFYSLSYPNAYACFGDQLSQLMELFDENTADHYDVNGVQTCGECEACTTFSFATAAHENHSRKFVLGDMREKEVTESFQISGHRVDVYWLTKGEPVTYREFLELNN